MSPKHPKRPAQQKPQTAAPAAGGTPEGDRIAKVLARAGVASRREAERMITEGRVTVNGQKIDSPALNVTAADRILVDERPIGPPERTRLWLYHKPTGLVTTARDEQGRETIFDALPEDLPRVMSVGRLDLTSEGLLLLTNDGELKRRLELPETGWVRKYRVRVKGTPSEASLAPLREGVVLDGEHFQPMAVSLDRQQGANAWLTVGLREGKNREIRRAMESIGLSVNRLIRVSYGPFLLGKLASGAVEEIRPKVLRDQLGIEPPEEEAPAKRVIRKGRPPRKVLGGAGRPGAPAAEGRGKGNSRPDSKADRAIPRGARLVDAEDMGVRRKAPARGRAGDKETGDDRTGQRGGPRQGPGSRTRFGAGTGKDSARDSGMGSGRNSGRGPAKGAAGDSGFGAGSPGGKRFSAGTSGGKTAGKTGSRGQERSGGKPEGRPGSGKPERASTGGKPRGASGGARTGVSSGGSRSGGKPPRGGPRRG
ncbi:MAG: pseudouridine synthase [Rhodobacteraceae bacterium]|nr:pseudouridine synthase [Paracoccaceae bacterium]MBR9820912.1 pseudouridine synthase [Paracoccaceae bacterium]